MSSSAIGVLTSANGWEGRVSTMEGLRGDNSGVEERGECSGEGLAVGELEGEWSDCVCSTHASVERDCCINAVWLGWVWLGWVW